MHCNVCERRVRAHVHNSRLCHIIACISYNSCSKGESFASSEDHAVCSLSGTAAAGSIICVVELSSSFLCWCVALRIINCTGPIFWCLVPQAVILHIISSMMQSGCCMCSKVMFSTLMSMIDQHCCRVRMVSPIPTQNERAALLPAGYANGSPTKITTIAGHTRACPHWRSCSKNQAPTTQVVLAKS